VRNFARSIDSQVTFGWYSVKAYHHAASNKSRSLNVDRGLAFKGISTACHTLRLRNSKSILPQFRSPQMNAHAHCKVPFLVLFGRLGLTGGLAIIRLLILVAIGLRGGVVRNCPLCVGVPKNSPTEDSHASFKPRFSSAGTTRMVFVLPMPPRQPWTHTTLSP
jgi:hypothetical protein